MHYADLNKRYVVICNSTRSFAVVVLLYPSTCVYF